MLVFNGNCDNCGSSAKIDVNFIKGQNHVGCADCGVVEDITVDLAKSMTESLATKVKVYIVLNLADFCQCGYGGQSINVLATFSNKQKALDFAAHRPSCEVQESEIIE